VTEDGFGSRTDERRLRRVVVAAAVTQGAINMDFWAMGVALPRMADDLGTTATELQWVVSGYLVALGAFFVAGGRLGDIYGRRRLLLVGMAIFAVSSAIAGAGTEPAVVIAFRVAQGVGAAIAFPVSLAVVTNAFPAERVGRAIGLVFAIAVIGTAAGPFVGGLLTELVSWRLIFWLNVPLAAVVAWLVLTSVEESRDLTVPRRIDLPGLGLVVAGVTAVSIAFDQADSWGWTSPATLGLLGAGVVLLAGFVAVEGRVRHPLLDLGLLRIPTMGTMLTAGSIGNISYNVVIFGSTLYLQQVRDLDPLQAGLVFIALAVGAAVAGQLSGRLGRFPSWRVMFAALVIGGAASVGLGFADAWAAYVPLFALTGFGLGLGWAFTSVATQQIVPPEKAGAESGLVLTLLVGLGGIAVAVAASAIESRGGGGSGQAIRELIRVAGAIALAGAALVALLGRRRGRPRPPAPAS
jgi:MFS family permease